MYPPPVGPRVTRSTLPGNLATAAWAAFVAAAPVRSGPPKPGGPWGCGTCGCAWGLCAGGVCADAPCDRSDADWLASLREDRANTRAQRAATAAPPATARRLF